MTVNYKKTEDIVLYYGEDKQIVKAIEEFSELIKELCKHLSNKDNYDEIRVNICEEIADSYIMLMQLRTIFNYYDEDMFTTIEYKINRTLKRIEEMR